MSFWFQYFEIIVTSRQLDCEFKNTLENSELQDSQSRKYVSFAVSAHTTDQAILP